MNLKGIVSSKNENLCKVFIKEKEFLSAHVPICEHVGNVNIGDKVIVSFFESNLSEGAIIGKL